MTTEDAIRAALQREALRHTVNPALPSSTIARARVSRFLAAAGVAAVATSVVFAGLSVANLRDSSTRLAPGSQPSSSERAPTESEGGAPLLLITEDGWGVIRADQYSRDDGEMTFTDGTHEMELTWRADETHETYVEDRRHDAAASWQVTIAGSEAILIQYEGTTDFTALWLHGDKSLELRGLFPTVEEYKAVASTLDYVDEETWLAALPDDSVQPSERPEVVESMLADIPVHPDVDVEKMKASSTVSDRYQLGARVSGTVACAWIGQWVEAQKNGDEGSAREAVDAMATSHEWAILEEMKDQGGWSEVVWEYADAMAGDGNVSGGVSTPIEDGYRDGLGCERGE